ncbi:hypothetical protein [Brevundimonas diminuta]|jgi:hypothetical protein|uniref:hypothetical protein n=1 Tax=Brevundimonas diminuta TaxID=293 RepID=UPI001F573B33|nr:hypothetical protein [Brevundimonas diminuta]
MIPAQCEVDWGAWATLFTGCAAVLAALIVGLKQSRIQELQAKIADRVASTEEARIRLELFEKRYAFVVVLNRFVSRVRSKKDFWTEEDTAFLEESKRAQYLFPREMKAIIDRLWYLAADYQGTSDMLTSRIPGERDEAIKQRPKLRNDLNKIVEDFYEVCDREMRPFQH